MSSAPPRIEQPIRGVYPAATPADTLPVWMTQTGRPLATPDGRLALRLLEQAGDHGVTIADLRHEGLQMPAQALYEVELAGWLLERKAGRTRLRPADAPPPKPFEMPPKVRVLPRSES